MIVQNGRTHIHANTAIAATSRLSSISILILAAGILLSGLASVGWSAANSERPSAKPGVLERFVDWISDDIVLGKGTSVSSDGLGRTTATWSDGRNRLKIKIDGKVEFGDDDRTIARISNSGSLTIWEKQGSRTTRLEVNADRSGDLAYDFEVDGKTMPFDSKGEAWLADVLVDIIRKTGVGAERRANRIIDREGIDGLIDEVQFVEGDYVKRQYFNAALARPDLSSTDCSSILSEAALSMDSDYEKAEILIAVGEHRSADPTLAGDYVDVAATMESDYEIRRALSAIKLDENTDQSVLDAVLQIVAKMDSDYETAQLLISFAPLCLSSARLSEMYIQAVAGIGSDYEARRALMELDWNDGMPLTAVAGALSVAGRMKSDYEAAQVLTELAPYSADDDRAVTAFMAAVGQISSDYEAGRSLTRFAANDDLDVNAVLALLAATEKLSSGYEQGNVLRKTMPHCRGNEELEDAFLTAVDAVNSDYERDRLYSDFYRGDREARRARRSN